MWRSNSARIKQSATPFFASVGNKSRPLHVLTKRRTAADMGRHATASTMGRRPTCGETSRPSKAPVDVRACTRAPPSLPLDAFLPQPLGRHTSDNRHSKTLQQIQTCRGPSRTSHVPQMSLQQASKRHARLAGPSRAFMRDPLITGSAVGAHELHGMTKRWRCRPQTQTQTQLPKGAKGPVRPRRNRSKRKQQLRPPASAARPHSDRLPAGCLQNGKDLPRSCFDFINERPWRAESDLQQPRTGSGRKRSCVRLRGATSNGGGERRQMATRATPQGSTNYNGGGGEASHLGRRNKRRSGTGGQVPGRCLAPHPAASAAPPPIACKPDTCRGRPPMRPHHRHVTGKSRTQAAAVASQAVALPTRRRSARQRRPTAAATQNIAVPLRRWPRKEPRATLGCGRAAP